MYKIFLSSIFASLLFAGCSTGHLTSAASNTSDLRAPAASERKAIREDFDQFLETRKALEADVAATTLSDLATSLNRFLDRSGSYNLSVTEASLSLSVSTSTGALKVADIARAFVASEKSMYRGEGVENFDPTVQRTLEAIQESNSLFAGHLTQLVAKIETPESHEGHAVGDFLLQAKLVAEGKFRSANDIESFIEMAETVIAALTTKKAATSEQALAIALSLKDAEAKDVESDFRQRPQESSPELEDELGRIMKATDNDFAAHRESVKEITQLGYDLQWSPLQTFINVKYLISKIQLSGGMSADDVVSILSKIDVSDDFRWVVQAVAKAQKAMIIPGNIGIDAILSYMDFLPDQDGPVFTLQDERQRGDDFSVRDRSQLKELLDVTPLRPEVLSAFFEKQLTIENLNKFAAVIVKKNLSKQEVLLSWNRFSAEVERRFDELKNEFPYRRGRIMVLRHEPTPAWQRKNPAKWAEFRSLFQRSQKMRAAADAKRAAGLKEWAKTHPFVYFL